MRACVLFNLEKTRLRKLTAENISSLLKNQMLSSLKEFYERTKNKVALRKLNTISNRVSNAVINLTEQNFPNMIRFYFSYDLLTSASGVTRDGRVHQDILTKIENECWLRMRSGWLVVFDLPWKSVAFQLANLISLYSKILVTSNHYFFLAPTLKQ